MPSAQLKNANSSLEETSVISPERLANMRCQKKMPEKTLKNSWAITHDLLFDEEAIAYDTKEAKKAKQLLVDTLNDITKKIIHEIRQDKNSYTNLSNG